MYAKFRDYLILCKPRVVLLMLLTLWAGMYLGAREEISWWLWLNATIGVAFICGSAATLNHMIDYKTDALMERTKFRPLVTQKVSLRGAGISACLQGVIGFILLFYGVNVLTAVLTVIAGMLYSGVYSLFLKRATSQNIVIGGLSGALPPLLGWAAVTDTISAQGWILVLIIFAWTPAHFWALCLHRLQEYKETTIPMLPITHGISFTKIHIVFYSLLTIACSLLPYAIGMSGKVYLVSALILGAGLLIYALKLQFATEFQAIALKTFHYSLIYLTGVFLMLLLDHYVQIN